MKHLAASIVIIYLIGVSYFAFHYMTEKKEYPPLGDNPFVKLGNIQIRNGVFGEIFKINNTKCYVLVQGVPNELGRGGMQMECE